MKPVISAFNREDVVWAAGLFDGEGCITWSGNHGRTKHGQLSLGMTDEEPVRRFAEVWGLGGITGERRSTAGWKTLYRWRVTKFESMQAILVAMYPWLSPRRQQRARELLTEHKGHRRYVSGAPHAHYSKEQRRRIEARRADKGEGINPMDLLTEVEDEDGS